MNSLTIPSQAQDNNIVGNNEASIMNIPKQVDAYPFVEAAQNLSLSQELSMMMAQLENDNYGSSSKQSLQHDFSLDADISSILYGNDMFPMWYENQELVPDYPEPMVTDHLWNY